MEVDVVSLLFASLSIPRPHRKYNPSAFLSQVPTTLWYQVEGRDPSKLRRFQGQDVDDLRRTIVDDSKLEVAANELTLYVKDPNSGQEVKLDEKLLKARGNFRDLVSDYGINDDNPIIVRLP